MVQIQIETIVPVLRVNNRGINQAFLENNLGLKSKLEEGAFLEVGDFRNAKTKLVLMESPGSRTRSVEGKKKLHKLVLRATNPQEVESLLARGAVFTKLYKGQKGYGFEAVSPEGDCFLVHAELSAADLVPILPPVNFTLQEDFTGLSEWQVESIEVNVPFGSQSSQFYQQLFPEQSMVKFVETEGKDLQAPAASVWDLDSFRLSVPKDYDWSDLEDKLTAEYFKDRKERFIQTTDPQGIELWFEK